MMSSWERLGERKALNLVNPRSSEAFPRICFASQTLSTVSKVDRGRVRFSLNDGLNFPRRRASTMVGLSSKKSRTSLTFAASWLTMLVVLSGFSGEDVVASGIPSIPIWHRMLWETAFGRGTAGSFWAWYCAEGPEAWTGIADSNLFMTTSLISSNLLSLEASLWTSPLFCALASASWDRASLRRHSNVALLDLPVKLLSSAGSTVRSSAMVG